ncbi:MAG: hypothetical protein ACYSSI_12410 [Planctomycetota bacterium]|jgi:hypothetical protein
MIEQIQIDLSSNDISEIVKLLNKLLKQVSMLTLSREELSIVEGNRKIPGFGNRKFSNVVKTINRFGIRDDSGDFYKLLNEVIGRITLNNPMFQIYDSIKFLLFNKLLERMTDKNPKFSQKELSVFFLQPHHIITNTGVSLAGVSLYDMVKKSQELSETLKSEDAKEFLGYGTCRRLFMLKANVDAITKIYSYHRIDGLTREEDVIMDQNINALYANIYAIMDCLSFVIAFEDNDYDISRNRRDFNKIGLYNWKFQKEYKKYKQLESKLNLKNLKSWFDEICDLRHPVAHRIPLYFPNIYNNQESAVYKGSMERYYDGCRSIYADVNITPQEMVKKSTELQKIRDNELSEINLFSGCFLHSDKESKRYYHLSRLVVDLGILYYLLYGGFKYIEELSEE